MSRQSDGVRFKSRLKEFLRSREGKIGQLHHVQQKVTSGRRDVEKVCGSL